MLGKWPQFTETRKAINRRERETANRFEFIGLACKKSSVKETRNATTTDIQAQIRRLLKLLPHIYSAVLLSLR